MYRKLEEKIIKISANELNAESSCSCTCAQNQAKDDAPKPAAAKATIYSGDHYNIGGKG